MRQWHPRQLVRTIAWEVVYPVYPSTPIGLIRREGDAFRVTCGEEDLGVLPTGDAASEAVWARFLEQSSVRHAQASVTHGGRDRHHQGGSALRPSP